MFRFLVPGRKNSSPIFVFLLFFFALSSVNAQIREIYRNETPSDNFLKKFSFYSASEGYVAFKRFIGYTTDSGRTYIKRTLTKENVNYGQHYAELALPLSIEGVHAFNNNKILVYGSYNGRATILQSTNGGESFTLVYRTPNLFSNLGFTDLKMLSNGNGFAVDEHRIVKTTDNGNTWTILSSMPGELHSLFVFDENNIVIVARNIIYKTTNGGINWKQLPAPASPTAVFFLTPSTGWVCSQPDQEAEGKMYGTFDGGQNWTLLTNPLMSISVNHLRFSDQNTGYATGFNGVLYKTSDGGKFWEALMYENPVPFGFYSMDMQMYTPQQLWVGGANGIVQITTNGGGTPYPKAAFKIDTTGYGNTTLVKLNNYSKPEHSFRWFRNGVEFSNQKDPSYSRDRLKRKDTIILITSNGVNADTLELYQEFHVPVLLKGFSPTVGVKDETITISGENFLNITSVSFGGVAARGFTVVSEKEIRAIVAEGTSGDIHLTSLYGGTVSMPGFRFLHPPVLNAFSPVSAVTGSNITISGENLLEIKQILIGGVVVPWFSVTDGSSLIVQVPSTVSGKIEVTTKAGKAEIAGFIAKPSITSFTPDRNIEGGKILIKGTSLAMVNSITIGGLAVQSFQVIDHNNLAAYIGAGASGNVEVTAPGGSASLPGFNFIAPPRIINFNPLAGPIGTTVTINGSGFSTVAVNNTVLFGTVKAVIKSATANSLTVEVPAGAGRQPISVHTRSLVAYTNQPFQVTIPGAAYPAPNSFLRSEIADSRITYFDLLESTDLDGDGKNDLIVSAITQGGAALFLYRNITLQQQPEFESPAMIQAPRGFSITTGDLDGDGRPDLATANGHELLLYRNISSSGKISLAQAISLPTPFAPSQVNISDIDMDGRADVLMMNTGYIRVYRNLGNMEFELVQFPFAGRFYLSDFDNDGKWDVLFQTETETKLCLNKSTAGRINFQSVTEIPITALNRIVVADLNGDNKPEIIDFNKEGNLIKVFRNTSVVDNIAFDTPYSFYCEGTPYTYGLVDVDGDAKLDIIITDRDTHLATYHNRSEGNVIEFSGRVNHGPNEDYYRGGYWHRTADLNNDGKPELFIQAVESKKIYIYSNDCIPKPYIGSFTPANAVAGTTIEIKGAHFTGTDKVSFGNITASSFSIESDSLIKAVVANGSTGSITVRNQTATYSKDGFVFGLVPVINTVSPAAAAVGTAVTLTGANFSSDLAGNIVKFGGVKATVTSASEGSLTVLVPTGAAPYPLTVTTNQLTVAASAEFIVTFPGDTSKLNDNSFEEQTNVLAFLRKSADMDGDGKQDLVMLTKGRNMAVAKNISVPGSISFDAPVEYPTGKLGIDFVLNDFDGDGKMDVAVMHETNDGFDVFRNTSTTDAISFAHALRTNYDGWVHLNNSMTCADFDGDGRPDLVFSDYDKHSLYYFKNISNAAGIRFAPLYLLRIYKPFDLMARDIDGDGKTELLVGGQGLNGSILFDHFHGASVTGFTEVPVGFTSRMLNVAVGVLSGANGTPEIAYSSYPNSFGIAQNISGNGGLSFREVASYPFNTETNGQIVIGDLNGDGRQDIVVGMNRYQAYFKNLTQNGNLKFDTAYNEIFSVGYGRNHLADLDGDGVLDLIVDGVFGKKIMRNKLGDITNLKICKNADTVLAAGLTGISYKWQWDTGSGFTDISNIANITGESSIVLKISAIPASWNNYKVRCIVDGKTARQYLLQVNSNILTASLSMEVPEKEVCIGNAASVFAIVTNGGEAPQYLWKLDGVDVGPNFKNYQTPSLTHDATIQLTVISSAACVTNPVLTSVIVVKVKEPSIPKVAINASKENICKGDPVVFTAIPSEGAKPVTFIWEKNGKVVGTNSATYQDIAFAKNDRIVVKVQAYFVCGGSSFVISPEKTLTVTDRNEPKPTIILDRSTQEDAGGQFIELLASIDNAGAILGYQWYDSSRLNSWKPIDGATHARLKYYPVSTEDKVKCDITFKYNCGDEQATLTPVFKAARLIMNARLSPNPVRSVLYIDNLMPNDQWQKLQIVSLATGGLVLESDAKGRTSLSIPVANLVPGMYMVVLRSSEKDPLSLRFMKL